MIDLTHELHENFPTFFGVPQFRRETLATFSKDGYNLNDLHMTEHTGTHIDAPLHFSADGSSISEIPITELFLPIIVVDIRERAERDPDTSLTPSDLMRWESVHGEIPAGCCVAMNSGWSHFVSSPRFRNADDDGVMHFPGFHAEAAAYLLEARAVSGIAVDTLSLDQGRSTAFEVHTSWLPAGRWGLEAVANLDQLPPRGAFVFVGAPKIRGATGAPVRILATV